MSVPTASPSVPPATGSTGLAVRARGLHKTFEPDAELPVRALRGLDLTVEEGELVALVGPSGCGKSTLINVLAGLEVPDSGSVDIAGRALTTRSEDERTAIRREHIGIVFQRHNLLDSLSALNNVALACRVGGSSAGAAERRARDLLSLVALGAKVDAPIGSLSGGQRQRVAIARAIANRPPLVLADEPTGALDSVGADEIAELFVRLNEQGQTFVVVTHDPQLARIADRVERMRDGRLLPDDGS